MTVMNDESQHICLRVVAIPFISLIDMIPTMLIAPTQPLAPLGPRNSLLLGITVVSI